MKKDGVTFINFRDLGGLKTSDGRSIMHGKLFRTSALAPVTHEDVEFLASKALDSVIDLRTPKEVKEKPDALPDGVEYVSASVFDTPDTLLLAPTRGTFAKMFFVTNAELAKFRELLYEGYRYMATASHAFNEIFDRMDDGKTIAFHCTAGKDRTGYASLLVEYSLGRTLGDCRREYLASNVYRAEHIKQVTSLCRFLPMRAALKDLLAFTSATHDSLLDAAFDTVYSQYPDFDTYIERVFGITPERRDAWRRIYTK